MSQKPAYGTGTLTAGSSTQTVSSPITLPAGNSTLVDNETDAVITASGDGNDHVTEYGAGANITLQNGNAYIQDYAGGTTLTTGNGDQYIGLDGAGNSVTIGTTPSGGVSAIFLNHGDNTVTAGDGALSLTTAGQDNVITAGDGVDRFVVDAFTSADGRYRAGITSDTLALGNGTNRVLFEGASSNQVFFGTGTDVVEAIGDSYNSFVINAGGGTQKISGFTLTNGDWLDLSQFLPSAARHDLSRFIGVTNEAGPNNSMNTVLTITNPHGLTDTVTLLNTGGSITLAALRPSLFV